MANGGIIGPTKVVNTPQTKTETFTSSGTFHKDQVEMVDLVVDLVVEV